METVICSTMETEEVYFDSKVIIVKLIEINCLTFSLEREKYVVHIKVFFFYFYKIDYV